MCQTIFQNMTGQNMIVWNRLCQNMIIRNKMGHINERSKEELYIRCNQEHILASII